MITVADAAAESGAWAKGESFGENVSRRGTRPELGGGGCFVNIRCENRKQNMYTLYYIHIMYMKTRVVEKNCRSY